MAKQPMLKFVTISRAMPEKRAAEARRQDFQEIYAEYAATKAAEQSSRCSQCGVPYCQTHCPLHNNIPDWLRLTAEGRLQEAYELSQATNTFPEICGRICPQDRLCEGNCVIEQSGHGTVTIGAVEKYLTDLAWENGWVAPIKPGADRVESVGIIGAGPGGLAAADVLRRAGVQVTVYDRYDRAGGLLTYGIPGFKLEKPVVMQRIEQLELGGVQFVLNCKVGEDLSFDAIRGQHDAILIATGVYKARDIEAPGVGAKGVVRALDYLTASNRKSFGDEVPEFDSGELNATGKRVVVIGGGDTAMDCVRTAIRQGAVSVKCLYRRDKANMPGSQREVQNAEEEGVDFVWLSAPKGFTGGEVVDGVMVQKMRLGAPDASGRQSPEVIEGADMLFITAGMGGGTGTGAAPVIAQIAKEMGILTVAVVTKPFGFERSKRMSQADQGIKELANVVDSLITIPNDKLMPVLGKDTSLLEVFEKANDVLRGAVQGIAELITCPGLINVDFADVRTVMSEMGMAMMGTGTASGENRAKEAAQAAISSPLLEDINISGAQGILVNVTAGLDLSIGELDDVGTAITELASADANVVVGTVIDSNMTDGELRVTMVATGLGKDKVLADVPLTAIQPENNGEVDYKKLERPTAIRKKIVGDTIEMPEDKQSMEYLEIPAFLRRQAD